MGGTSTAGAFALGVAAGYGVAVPVGAIAVLILDCGLRRGLRPALAAGLGTAAADLFYAIAAAVFGSAVAGALAPHASAFRLVAAGVLAAVALRLVLLARRAPADVDGSSAPGLAATAVRFLALTIVNPTTAASFAAVVLGMSGHRLGIAGSVAFAAGAFLASLSWQSLIATAGAVLHRRVPPGARFWTSIAGAIIIALLALRLALLA